MSDPRFVLGVDVGGTKLRAALATLDGESIAELTEPTLHAQGRSIVEQIRLAADGLAHRAGVERTAILAAGISLPVTIDPRTGRLGSTHNVPGLAAVDARAELARALDMPVALDNDANLAALGEARRGAAVGLDDFVVIAIGTGIGMGVVARGQLLRGAHGAAGEIGFLPLGADPFDPGNQVGGPYEAVVAGPAIRAKIEAAVRPGVQTSLRSGATLADIAAATAAGDGVASDLLEEEARLIALGIAAIVAILDPVLVLLSGGVGAVDGLLEPVRRHAAGLMRRPPEIRAGALGDRAPLEGAISLALRTLAGT